LAAKISGKQERFKSFAKIVDIYLNRTKYLELLSRRIFFESISAGAKIKKTETLLSGKEKILSNGSKLRANDYSGTKLNPCCEGQQKY